ncbi:MAG TPA: hypothetical protein VF086_08950 [Propionibacteriaceae bacterium]
MTQRRTDHLELDVGVSSMVHHEAMDEVVGMIILGIDPHKLVHTASALELATNRRVDSVEIVEIEATWGGYLRLLK